MANYQRTALFIGKAPLAIPEGATASGLSIEGQQPEGTDRRIIFGMPDGTGETRYFKFVAPTPSESEGQQEGESPSADTRALVPTPLEQYSLTAAWVLENGNTTAELQSVTSIPEWAGQSVYPVIALSAPEESTVAPTLKLGIKYTVGMDTFDKTEESPIYALSDSDVAIISIGADTSIEKDATCKVEARLLTGGAWGDWQDVSAIANTRASGLQFRATYHVSGLGSGTAKVTRATATYAGTAAKVAEATTEIITQTKRYSLGSGDGLRFAQALIVHDKLVDADIRAYCSFRDAPKQVDFEQIAVSGGGEETVPLPGTGIYAGSLELRANGTEFHDFDYNTETNQATYTRAQGEAITASFEHGWTDENWREMERVTQQPYESSGRYATRFNYALGESETGKTIVAVKFALERPGGTETDVSLGTATGDTQSFRLPHYARADTIACTGQWTYDDETRQLLVLADKGTEIKVSYQWVAESPKVHNIACGWAELG